MGLISKSIWEGPLKTVNQGLFPELPPLSLTTQKNGAFYGMSVNKRRACRLPIRHFSRNHSGGNKVLLTNPCRCQRVQTYTKTWIAVRCTLRAVCRFRHFKLLHTHTQPPPPLTHTHTPPPPPPPRLTECHATFPSPLSFPLVLIFCRDPRDSCCS